MAIKSGIQKARVSVNNLPLSTVHTVGTIAEIQGNQSVATFVLPSHGLQNGNRVYITTTGKLPVGINTETEYFVVDRTDNTFKLSTVNPLTEDAVPYKIFNMGGETYGAHQIIRVGYYTRYRVISEDRNRFSHWSPVYFVEDPNTLTEVFVVLDGGEGV